MKFKKVFLLIGIIGLLISSCADKKDGEQKTTLLSNFVSITDNEDKGVKEVLEYYAGYCEYSIGASASTNEGNKKYFTLKMSKSDALEQYADLIQMPASNIAFLFFRNLQEEREQYDEIRTVILFNDGKEMTFKYPTEQLKAVEERIPLIEKIIETIKNKEFKAIENYLNDESIAKYDKSELVANLETLNPQFGEVQEFLPYGFRFNHTDSGFDILHISGMVVRDIQSHEFSADFDLNAPKSELLKIDYNF